MFKFIPYEANTRLLCEHCADAIGPDLFVRQRIEIVSIDIYVSVVIQREPKEKGELRIDSTKGMKKDVNKSSERIHIYP